MDPAPDLNIIDRFMAAFSAYIDSGFGLLGPDVGFLTTTLIAIDVTLAGLWWALEGDDNVLGRLIKKVLYVGAFAFILGNFKTLSEIIFRSFAGLGLTAGGGGGSSEDLLRPGKLASIGFTAAHPLIAKASELTGWPEVVANAVTIALLALSWVLVVLAFFVMAIQLFVTVLEFKLTSLAGFVLVPFAFWNKTSFLAERVLGNVISSGVKVMVLAVKTLVLVFATRSRMVPVAVQGASIKTASSKCLGRHEIASATTVSTVKPSRSKFCFSLLRRLADLAIAITSAPPTANWAVFPPGAAQRSAILKPLTSPSNLTGRTAAVS